MKYFAGSLYFFRKVWKALFINLEKELLTGMAITIILIAITKLHQKYLVFIKGQLFSFESTFWYPQFSQITKKKFDFTTMIPQVDMFLFVSWEKLKTPKRHFEIN